MKLKQKQTMAERLSLPAEAVSQAPLTEIRGKRSVTIENHGGILEYSEECVRIAVQRGAIRVVGSEICIARMTKQRVEIRGRLSRVELE